MTNFEYYTPTKVIFGKDCEKQVGEVLKEYGYKKIMIQYGGGSVKKSGLLDKIIASIQKAGLDYTELGGVEPNPKLSQVRKGIEFAKSEKIDFILAVGGGSVIDSSKAIALGLANDVDPWEIFARRFQPTKAFPIGSVLTIAAAGSEMSNSVVITNEELKMKRGFGSNLNRAVVAFMNPENTFTVSPYQTACGIVDIMMHTIDRYFAPKANAELTDHLAEGLLMAVKEAGWRAIQKPDDYEARATLMWASSVSHNGLTGCGRDGMPFTTHQLEHDVSGVFDFVSHGAGLAVLYPALAKYTYQYDLPRYCQFATRVWKIEMNHQHPEETALKGIEAVKEYFAKIGMPTTLKELGIEPKDYEKIINQTTEQGNRVIASYIPLTKKEILEIYRLAEE